jgi:hypothetical protein
MPDKAKEPSGNGDRDGTARTRRAKRDGEFCAPVATGPDAEEAPIAMVHDDGIALARPAVQPIELRNGCSKTKEERITMS